MPKGILVAQSSPVSPEREDDYNKWYDEEHIPDILAIPGFVSARRYRVRDAGPIKAAPATPTYLTIYEIEADDLDAKLTELRERSADGRVRRSNAVRLDPPPITTFYELIE